MKKTLYFLSLSITIITAVGGLVSLIPAENASFTSLLGYKSLCTFNPASVLFCFAIAGSSCFLRATFLKYETGTIAEKIKKHLHSLIPVSILLVLAIFTTVWFINVNNQYIDGATHATENVSGDE